MATLRTADTVTARYRRPPAPWLWAALPLVPLLAAAATTLAPHPDPSAPQTVATATPAPAPSTPGATTPGSPVDLRRDGASIVVSAVVPDERTRDALLDAVHAAAPGRGVVDETSVAPGRPLTDVSGLPAVVKAAEKRFSSYSARLDDAGLSLRGVSSGKEATAAFRTAATTALPGRRVDVEATTEVPTPGTTLSCDRIEEQISARLIADPVNFDLESARVDKASTTRLQEIGTALRLCRSTGIQVNGHADATGPQALNLDLARERAEAVRTILVGAGVDPKNVTAQGFGALRNIAPNDTPAGREKNRRVVILVQDGGRS